MFELPGITVCIGEGTPSVAASATPGSPSPLKHEFFSGPDFWGRIAHHGTLNPTGILVDTEAGVGLALDGWVLFDEPEARDSLLEACLRSYRREGISFVERLNGAFNLVLWDLRDRTVYVANDRYGLRPMCHGVSDGVHILAPQARAILEVSRKPAKLNERTLYNLLSFSRVYAGEETLFEGIRSLPPATLLTWSDGTFSERRYWDYVFDPVETVGDDFVEEFTDAFRTAVNRHLSGWDRVGLNLSGGLDSRAVAAALDPATRRRMHSFTWGYSDECEEVRLARQTAETFQVPWRFVGLSPEDFLTRAEEGMRVLEGRDALVQSYGLKVFPEVAKACEVSTSGLALDLLCGGSYSSVLASESMPLSDDRIRKVLDKYFYFRDHAKTMFQNAPEAESAIEEIRSQLRADLTGGFEGHPADMLDRFAMRQRAWRYIFPRQSWQRLFVEDVAPTFDNRVIDLLLRVPPQARAHHHFYRRFLERLDPKTMEIPYQRTLLPPSVPTQYWGEAARIESEREDLLRRIFFETGGKVYIPYHRYYSNFDEWLRVNPTWRSTVENLLLSSESLLGQRYLRPEWLHRLVEEQESGQAAHYSRLVVLMTAEMILREFA